MNNTQNNNQNYFRITGYDPQNDYCFILDSNGMFEKLWQFSSMLIQKGLKVLEVSNFEKILDVNITLVEQDNDHIILRATADGKPEYLTQIINGINYKAIKVLIKSTYQTRRKLYNGYNRRNILRKYRWSFSKIKSRIQKGL